MAWDRGKPFQSEILFQQLVQVPGTRKLGEIKLRLFLFLAIFIVSSGATIILEDIKENHE